MFAISVFLLLAAGWALLGLFGLQTRSRVGDLGLAWLLGGGYFGLAVAALRFIVGVAYSTPLALMVVSAPVLLWAWRWKRGTPRASGGAPSASRWVPRPRWLFAPLASYVLVMTASIGLHGFSTPTNTDDGMRVRAFASTLAFDDEWGPEARNIFVMTGPVGAFVPSLGFRLMNDVDHFAVNYVSFTNLLALLLLVIFIPCARGAPARGWSSAFALLSLPLFMYHCTSTYADAWVAIYVGAAVFFLLELSVSSDPADIARALLLLVVAAMAKREAELVVAPVAFVVLLAAFVRLRQLRPIVYLAPYLLFVATKVAAVGAASAFPFVRLFMGRAEDTVHGQVTSVMLNSEHAPRMFLYALFGSGNAGLLFYALVPCALVGIARARRLGLHFALLAVGALFAEVTLTSLWLYPRFTVDQSTVHRALLPTSVAAALWIAALLSQLNEPALASAPQGGAAAPDAAIARSSKRRARAS